MSYIICLKVLPCVWLSSEDEQDNSSAQQKGLEDFKMKSYKVPLSRLDPAIATAG